MRYVHSLTRIADSLYAPCELGKDAPQSVCFYIPVNPIEKEYLCDVFTTFAFGYDYSTKHLFKKQKYFILKIDDKIEIQFKLKSTKLFYAGKLEHEDFKSPLLQLEAVDDLDNLLLKKGKCVVGCNPFDKYFYQGLNLRMVDLTGE